MWGAVLLTLSIGFGGSALAAPALTCAPAPAPATVLWDGDALRGARAAVQAKDPLLQPAYDALLADAQAALSAGPFSVTHKTRTPPSGSKNDYYSVGPYWWPDPDKSDGLPYVRRDGQTNPERRTDAFDSTRMSALASTVETLALADYLSGESRYGTRAAELLRVWFVDPATRMNPNLDFAQSIPGRTDGRGIGIIDTYRLVGVVEAAELLASSGRLPAGTEAALRQWFVDYARWMVRSDNGREERATLNNHGVYYDAQLARFAVFAGDAAPLPTIMDGVRRVRLPGQVDNKGRMPRELERTRPYHYTGFNLRGFMDIARIAGCAGDPVWSHETGRGASLPRALDHYAAHAPGLKRWRYKELRPRKTDLLFVNLCRARGLPPGLDAAQQRQLSALRGEHAAHRIMLLENGCRI